MRFHIAGFAIVICALLGPALSAQAPDPLRLIPAEVDGVAKVENPRALYEAIYGHEVFLELMKLDAIAALYDTTAIRRVYQVLAYFEKELGHKDLELLDRLAGGGVAFAGKIDESALLLVVQAKDEELLKKFVALTRKVIDQELARQDAKEKVRSTKYRGVEALHLAKKVYAARVGAALVFTNKEAALKQAIDLHMDKGKKSLADHPSMAEAKTLLPKDLLAWGAFNLEQARKLPGFKDTLNSLGLDPVTLFAIGGLVDIIKRSPFVCAGIARDGKNLQARIAMPRGRDGMAPLAAMFLPQDERGSLPMLEPPQVLSCTSYFLDLNKFWESRQKILTKEQAKNIDDFEKQTKKYLRGYSLGALLEQAGKHQRVVVAIPRAQPYKIKPTVQTGSFALVLDMRDPAFGKALETILRGAALVGGFQFGVKMVEEKHAGHTLVTYYFPEKGKFEGDTENIRFNFTPCFTQVGNHFVVSSTLELGKDLVDCLLKEQDQASPATSRTTLYGPGLAANFRQAEDLLVTQAILNQALPATTAKKQFDELTRLLEGLGRVQLDTRYNASNFTFDIQWLYEKKNN